MKINWQPIRNEYITGVEVDGSIVYPSMRDLSEKYKVDFSGLGTRAEREGWKEQRQIYSNKIQTKTEQKKIEVISERGVQLDLIHFDIAEKAGKKIQKLMEAAENTNKITELLFAALKSQELGKKALGENTGGNEKAVIQIVVSSEEAKKQVEKIGERT